MLTVTGQNEDISHWLQIGKDQKGDNQRDENGYQFNNIGFIGDISILADTPEGIRTTHDARTCTLMPNKSVTLSASACQVSLH